MNATARMIPGTLRSDVSMRGGRFHLLTDEPPSVGGEDAAATPHELLVAALAACVATTLTMYARTKEWELGEVEVHADYDTRSEPRRYTVEVRLGGDLTPEQLTRLEKVAASCAVRRSLEADVVVEETLVAVAAV